MNNMALKKKYPGVQGKLNWPGLHCSLCVLSLNVYYHKYGIILQMSIWRRWQASAPFYSHVQVFLFILVAFCD